MAVRLDEIISAHGGADPFEEALTLLVARLAHEASGGPPAGFVGGAAGAPARVNELVAAAAARWPGVVEPGRTTGLGGAALARCAAVLDGVALLGDELVGLDAIFEHLVAHVAKGQKGQFFTPRHVIAEVVAMLAPRPGEHVVDPACGSGGFLWHALAAAPGCAAWGFDVDPRAVRVARVMLAAHGAPVGRVACVDSLRRPALEDHARDHGAPRGFDVVLTNPPFAGDVGRAFDGAYELARGRVERDVLFVERVVELLRPGGRYAIVLPHNKVGGATWSHVRRWLLARTEVVAVLGLGRPTFLPHTSQKACVVIGRRRARALAAPPAGERVLFFVSERAGKDARGRLVRDASGAIDHDLGAAAPAVRARLAARGGAGGDGDGDAGGDGGAVTGAARARRGPRADRAASAAAGRVITRRVGELGPALVLAPERFDPRRAVTVAGARRLGELVEVVSDTVDARALPADAPVLVLDTGHAWEGLVLARHAPVTARDLGSAKRRLAPGDVIISRLRPYLRQVAFVDDGLFARAPGGNLVVASTEFYVLRRRGGRGAGGAGAAGTTDGTGGGRAAGEAGGAGAGRGRRAPAALDPAGLVPYLLSAPVQAALAAGQEGGHHPRFERAQLEDLPVSDALVRRVAAMARAVRDQAASFGAAVAGGRALIATVERELAPSPRRRPSPRRSTR